MRLKWIPSFEPFETAVDVISLHVGYWYELENLKGKSIGNWKLLRHENNSYLFQDDAGRLNWWAVLDPASVPEPKYTADEIVEMFRR